ncbi:protein of unknown function [Butyrivibrio sp. ob235]|uniref:DUF5050 domain-containing protein n=1 Tax=Butyrivibrio sp. ob235 TaxID=1761780 RepID=UPI0008ACE968|nr:DUF5050 domain-containing protein [Butyrivibrio sp. ob235]SEL01842.1 protein of unknown function [Butyrivibrio sp. ob235]
MKSRTFLIFFSIFITAITVGLLIYFISKRVPMNDENVVGNTPGNLYNGGLFLEMDGKVYFSNPLGNDCLYSMNPDETDVKQLTSMNTSHIVGAGKYIYFYLDYSKKNVSNSKLKGLGNVSVFYGLYRSQLDGEKQEVLDREYISSVQLVGSYLYYNVDNGNKAGLNKIRIDERNQSLVTAEKLDPSCAIDGKIYYSGVDLDHDLHVMDTLSEDTSSILLSGNIWQPIVQNGFVYYIDAAHHYRLCRTNLSSGETSVLTDSRVDFYNMNEFNIFYATSEPGNQTLRVMKLDGSNNAVIAEGIFHALSLTSKYLYFKPFDVENVMYHVPVDGSDVVSTFLPLNK